MNKYFKKYLAIWAFFLALFHVAVFVTPKEAAGMNKFGGAFWSGYIFIMLAFIGQIAVSYLVFKEENLRKFFYKISLIRISWTGLILTLVFGALCMVIPNLPNWVGVIICFVILGFQAISLVKANVAADVVDELDEKVREKTEFIKSLAVEAELLCSKATSETVKKECKKVWEALRYSDPMSSPELSSVESEITQKFAAFSEAVSQGDQAQITALSEETILLVEQRNKKCRMLK